MEPILYWTTRIFIPKEWIKLGICLNDWLVILISMRRLVMPLKFLSPIHVFFYARSYHDEQCGESRAPPPQSLEYAPPFCDSCQSYDHDTNSSLHVIFMNFRLQQCK